MIFLKILDSFPIGGSANSCPLNGPDSSLAAAVAMAPFDSGFDPRQRRHLIRP